MPKPRGSSRRLERSANTGTAFAAYGQHGATSAAWRAEDGEALESAPS